MVVRTSTRETRARKASTSVGRTPNIAGTGPGSLAWDDNEDALLRKAVAEFGPKRWRQIADMITSRRKIRSPTACHERWIALTNHGEPPEKRKWTPEEDKSLVELVKQHDSRNWALIASELPGRSAKQCRERWQNQLRPDLNHGPWAPSEDAVIVAWQRSVGNKWATIAEQLVGRTDNMVKNRWHSTLTRETGRPPVDPHSNSFTSSTDAARQEAATMKRKRKPKSAALRPKSKKRKRSSSSDPKKPKKKKKRVSRPTKTQRLTIQSPHALPPSPKVPNQALDSPDAVDGSDDAVKGFPLFECVKSEDADEEDAKSPPTELAGVSLGFQQVKEERCDDWVPVGVLDEAPFLSEVCTWEMFEGANLLAQEFDSECEGDSDCVDDDDIPCHPSAVDEYSIEF